MKTAFLLSLVLFALSACNRTSPGPFHHYELTNDEAVSASQMGGAPWRQRR